MTDANKPKPHIDTVIAAHYSESEHALWKQLMVQHLQLMPAHACQEYLNGFELLHIPLGYIPTQEELNSSLMAAAGWQIVWSQADPHSEEYFALLATQKLPVPPPLRTSADINKVGVLDVFSRIVGHCPMLTHPAYARFLQSYGQLGQRLDRFQRISLVRLYWFTAEHGLIDTPYGLRAYGGSLLTCTKAIGWSLNSIAPKREILDPVLALRTPFRRDILQPLYYVLDSFDTLQKLFQGDVVLMMTEAKVTGLLPPLFTDD